MSILYVAPGASFETEALVGGPATWFGTGDVGTYRVRIDDGQGGTVYGPTTAGIVEAAAYSYIATYPAGTLSIVGTYHEIYDDGAGHEAPNSTIVVSGSAPGGPIPSVDDLAALMRARTKDAVGAEGTFTPQTRPTAEQVTVLIGIVVGEVDGAVGPELPAVLYGQAKRCIMFGVAALVELSYFPEQQNQGGADSSAAATYRQMYDEALTRLAAARKSYSSTASAGGGRGLGSMRVKTQATVDREAAEAAEAAP